MTTGNYEDQTEFARRYIAQGQEEGEAKGKAESLLVVLRARGLAVSQEIEDRVTNCTDIAQLDEWLRRAVVVASAREIFG